MERSARTQCPFCDEFLSEFKRLAATRNAELLSTNQSKYIRFICSKHRDTFTLTVTEARKGERWCNQCTDTKYAQPSPKARDLPRRIVDPVFEQAHLLDSARALYNSKISKTHQRSSEVAPIISAAKRDPYYAKNSSQTLALYAASSLVSESTYWDVIRATLDLKPQPSDQLYRFVARQVHPDKCTHPLAAEAFKRLGTEYKKLPR